MLRRRGVRLLGTMAVGGAAYAAGHSAARGQANEEAQNAQIAELQAQAYQAPPPMQQQAYAPPPVAAPPPAPAASSMDDKIEQLQKLAELKATGLLTDAELAVQKDRILSS